LEQMVGLPPGRENQAGLQGGGAIGAPYERPAAKGLGKSVPLTNNFFKTSTLRAPGNPQAGWAFEQMIDELAYAARKDPVEFRRQNLTRENRPGREEYHGHRYAALLDAVTRAAKWEPRVAASRLSDAPVVTGRGFAFGTYTGSMSAVVAIVEVDKRTGKIVAKDLYLAEDLGLTVNPEGAKNQFTGHANMATSRVLHEQIRFDTTHVTSADWVSYPIMRFKEHPRIHYMSIQRMDQIAGGGGESGADSVVAAIGNAFFDATGVRMRQAPLTPAKARAALKAAGVK
jgi:nicotinate dehydrogenase subunit B